MSNVSEDKLKQFLQKKLRSYESLPSEKSWESIQSKLLTEQSNTSGGMTGSVITLFLLISFLLRSTTIGEMCPSKLERQKLIFTQSAKPNPLDFLTMDAKKTVLTSSARNSYAVELGGTPELESGKTDTHQSDEQSETFIANTPTFDSINQANSNLESRFDFPLEKPPLIHFRQISLPQISEMLPVKLDSLNMDKNGRNMSETDDSKQQKGEQKAIRGFLVLKITPFYNSGIFTPLLTDGVQVGQFSQSKELLKNRLGLMLEIGYQGKFFDELDVEYFAGYKVFSKEMEYVSTVATEERATEQTAHRISAVTHILRAGVAIRLSYQPIVFSVAYERAIGSFTEHIGKQLISVGLGVEKKLSSRISIRPGIFYGLPVNGVIRHFSYRPIGWNVEIAWELGDKPSDYMFNNKRRGKFSTRPKKNQPNW